MELSGGHGLDQFLQPGNLRLEALYLVNSEFPEFLFLPVVHFTNPRSRSMASSSTSISLAKQNLARVSPTGPE